MMKNGKLGVYVSTDAVVANPEYAKQLVEEAGVDHFILRAGYGLDFPLSLGEAAEVVRGMKAKVCFMVGSWWGNALVKVLDGLPSKSWESRFPMDMPGSYYDAGIIAKYKKLCKLYKPDSICVTHTRYRHPGYIAGIFDEGLGDQDYLDRMKAAGIPRSDLTAARAAWEKAMGTADKASLLKASERGLIGFLAELSQDGAVNRFFDFRRDTVTDALRAFSQAVTSFGVSFGANSYSLIAANVCGQDYENGYAETCDFVQPLLPYMEFHRYEPIAAWARYVLQHAKVDEPAAVEISKRLFYLGDTDCPGSLNELDTCGEGSPQQIHSIVKRELELCVPYMTKPYKLQPILRGVQWDRTVTDRLVEEAKGLGFDSLVFMGCDYLTKSKAPSPASWLFYEGWF